MSFAATTELFEASRLTHPTDGELSQYIATFRWLREGTTFSMTSHNRTIPAISKSEFVIVPVGFWALTRLDRMLSGHSIRKIVGMQGWSSPMITPPTPWLEASQMPT
jgi:hypothetical protein